MAKINMINSDEMSKVGVKAIYTNVRILDRVEMWSGGDRDPIVEARIDAERGLAICEDTHKLLPYDITVSIPALKYDRSGTMLEVMGELERKCLMRCQLIKIHVIVFENDLAYQAYMKSNQTIIPMRA